MRLFVYGSLMTGGWAHGRLRGGRLLGACATEARFTLVDLGRYPGVVAGGITAIAGEVYEVDEALLVELDDFEDVPELYVRDTLATPFGEAVVYRYVGGEVGAPVPSGDWRTYFRSR